jgi:hypothetical protein
MSVEKLGSGVCGNVELILQQKFGKLFSTSELFLYYTFRFHFSCYDFAPFCRRGALSPAYRLIKSDTLMLSYNQLRSDTLLLSYNQLRSGTLLLFYNQLMSGTLLLS